MEFLFGSLQLIGQQLYFVVNGLQAALHVQVLRAFDFGIGVFKQGLDPICHQFQLLVVQRRLRP